eukprot:2857410-Pyramimonas_sp.AAC.1
MRAVSGGSQYNRVRTFVSIAIAPDWLALDLDVLYNMFVAQIHSCPSCDMVLFRAVFGDCT